MTSLRKYGVGLVAAAALGSLLLTSCAPTAVQLALKVQEGDVYRVRMISQSVTLSSSDAGDSTSYDTSGFDMTFTVAEVDEDGNIWLDIVYDWATTGTTAGTGDVDAPDEPDPGEEGVAELEGRGYSAKVAPNGEVLEIAGDNDLLNEVLDELGLSDEEILLGFGQMIENIIGDDGLKVQVSNVIPEYPEGEVEVGDSWTVTSELPGTLAMIVETTYTLRALEDGVATIDVASTVNTDPDAYPLDLTLYEITYDLSGSGEGLLQVDVDTGWTSSATITSTLSGESLIVMGDMELTVPMSVEGVTTLEMLD
jgi:hypothetical protein